MRKLDIAATILLFIGAINWGFVGIFDVNVIHLFLENQWGDRLLYSAVGIAAIYKIVNRRAIHSRWKDE